MKKISNIEDFKIYVRLFMSRMVLLEMETDTTAQVYFNVEVPHHIWNPVINFLRKELSIFPKIEGSIFNREVGKFSVSINLHLSE